MTAPLLELRDIRKSFGGVTALDGVSFQVLPGEVHALVGENGAGKSTLMNIASGVLQPDSGSILWDGQPAPELIPARLANWALPSFTRNWPSFPSSARREHLPGPPP
jgi:ribose transport system ATP-binding protein